MTLQRIKKLFLNRGTTTPYVGFPVTVHAGLSLGSPLRLYADETGTALLSASGTILTDSQGYIDVWVKDYPYYQLILRTVDRATIIDRVQTFGVGQTDNEGLESLSVPEVAAVRGLLNSNPGASPVLSVAGKAGVVTLVKEDVGLGNVDNTSDANKPLSTAMLAAMLLKLDTSIVSPFALTLLDDLNAAGMHATLGLGSAAFVPSSTFAPLSHGHGIGFITGLQAELDSKQVDILFQNEGTNLGTGGTVIAVNVTGGGAEASRVGDVVTINVPGGSSGVTDHGALTGLTDDDHPLYHTDARGDARYSILGHGHNDATTGLSGYMSGADKIKLNSIAAGATVNNADAVLIARANHTGVQPSSSISDLAEAIDDRVSALLVAGTNVSLVYNDGTGTLTINASGGGGGSGANLTASLAPTQIVVASDTGTDATLPATDGVNAGLFLPAEKTKLAAIAVGATVNSPDAALLARSNHTGSQASTTISDFSEAVDDRVAALIVPGANVTVTYNDAANTLTIAATGGGGGATNLSATPTATQITVASDTGADAVLPAADGSNAGLFLPAEKTKLAGIAAGATVNASDATLLARGNHTGTQASTTISDFGEAVDDRVNTLLQAGPNVSLTYNDVANILTIAATPAPSAPIVVTGTLGEGNVLTATMSGGFATGFQWYRDAAAIAGATDIDGTGTVSTYTQVNADVGAVLSIRSIGYVPRTIVGTVPGAGADTRPRFGLGVANAWTVSPAALLAAMTVVPGSVNNGRAGTFNLTTSAGNYGWVAVVASVTTGGLRFFDGIGYGGWSGAGLAGNNLGASPDPSESAITYNDGVTTWRFFRQDFINANPSPAPYTLS